MRQNMISLIFHPLPVKAPPHPLQVKAPPPPSAPMTPSPASPKDSLNAPGPAQDRTPWNQHDLLPDGDVGVADPERNSWVADVGVHRNQWFGTADRRRNNKNEFASHLGSLGSVNWFHRLTQCHWVHRLAWQSRHRIWVTIGVLGRAVAGHGM